MRVLIPKVDSIDETAGRILLSADLPDGAQVNVLNGGRVIGRGRISQGQVLVALGRPLASPYSLTFTTSAPAPVAKTTKAKAAQPAVTDVPKQAD